MDKECHKFRQFTGLYDATKWEELTDAEQEQWLKHHSKDDWKGKPIFEGDIISFKLETFC